MINNCWYVIFVDVKALIPHVLLIDHHFELLVLMSLIIFFRFFDDLRFLKIFPWSFGINLNLFFLHLSTNNDFIFTILINLCVNRFRIYNSPINDSLLLLILPHKLNFVQEWLKIGIHHLVGWVSNNLILIAIEF